MIITTATALPALLLAAFSTSIAATEQWPATLHQALQAYEAADAATYNQQPEGIAHYRHAQADLNGDAWPDAVVMVEQSGYCGTGGCTLLLLAGKADGFDVVDRWAIAREPIELTDEWRGGWRTLVVGRGGGGVPYGISLGWFEGGEYTGDMVEDGDPRLPALGQRERLELIEVGQWH